MINKQRGKLIGLFLASLTTLFFYSTEASAKNYGNVKAELVSIQAPDRFTANINEWPDIIGKKITIQIKGIKAPQLKGHCQDEKSAAKAAMTLTRDALENAKTIELRNVKRGEGFYLVAEVYADNQTLGARLHELLSKSEKAGEDHWCKAVKRASGKFKIIRD